MIKKHPLVTYLEQKYTEFCLPDYKGKSIQNIPNHMKYLHGLKSSSALAGKKPTKKINKTVLFILDGLGYQQWIENEQQNEIIHFLTAGKFVEPITSMFPSSTPPSLAGFFTGLTTQQHGLIDWYMYESSSDQIITTLPFTEYGGSSRDSLQKELNPQVLLSNKVYTDDFAGVKSYALALNEYSHSCFSTLAYKGSQVVPHKSIAELFENLSKLLAKDESSHINVYWGSIDSAGHTFGPTSVEYKTEIKLFFDQFKYFLKELPQSIDIDSINLQFVADHGQVEVKPDEVIWLNNLPELESNFAIGQKGKKILPWGGHRDVFIKVKAKKLNQVIDFLSLKLNGKALVIKSADALAAGLFGGGKMHPDFENRIGNLIILPLGKNVIWYKHSEDEGFKMKGVHGGLTSSEVQVPYAECTLSDILKIK